MCVCVCSWNHLANARNRCFLYSVAATAFTSPVIRQQGSATAVPLFTAAAAWLPISNSPSHNSSSKRQTGRFMSNEVEKAKEAAAAGAVDDAQPTVFDKLMSGEWDCDKVYEDEKVFAFRDISPQAPVHILVIPKQRDGLVGLSNAREDQKEILGELMYRASEIGKKECPNGFRVVVNDGPDGAQSVMHLHLHVLGGRQMTWPPG